MRSLDTVTAADLVVTTALGPSPDRGRRLRVDGQVDSCRSLLDEIRPRLERFVGGDRDALAPGPAVNRVFTRLVELVTADLGPGCAHNSGDPMGHGHWEVTETACRLIDDDLALSDRAGQLRQAAALAEGAMEHHYAHLIASTVAARRGPPPARPGELRVGSPQVLTRLRDALRPFPYARNYEQLVGAEVAALGSAATGTRLVFCGAGPLPLTGVWWHHLTGGVVTLVEIDPAAARAARSFLDGLAQYGAIDRDALDIVVADAGAIDLGPGTVLAASLLPIDAVLRIAAGRATRARRAEPLLVRSSTGLVARLAYERVDPARLTSFGARHRITVAPSRVVGGRPGLPPDIGVLADDPFPLHIAPPGVLNLTEIMGFDPPPTPERPAP
ncbi:MAG: nicotianamine synthase family protein [Acidimicrobiales bacterium]